MQLRLYQGCCIYVSVSLFSLCLSCTWNKRMNFKKIKVFRRWEVSDTFIPGFYHPIGLDFHPVYMTHCPCLLVLCPPNTASLVFYPGCLHQHPPGGDQASEKQACCCACLAVSHLQLEMLVCITLTRTAVRELLGHGKTLMVPEKTLYGYTIFLS